jgi:hypothetical protein
MELWKALAHLYPTAQPLIDYELRDDGAGAYIARWSLSEPQPTPAQLEAASAAYDAAAAARAAAAQQLRQQVVTLAQSAVGVRIDQLTAAQVRALVAILLRESGGLANDGTIRPLAQWVNT